MLGFSDILSLIAVAIGLPGIILFFLNRKGANRKLNVEEGGLTVSQFNAALPAYKDLLDRANDDRQAAIDELAAYKTEREGFKTEIERLGEDIRTIRGLFTRVVERSNITLTHEEQQVFESTKPTRRRPVTRQA